MITIKIGKKIKVQKYCLKGLKLFLLINNKWILIKFNKYEKELLYFAIKLFNKSKEN